jgi:uncharacterized protein (DUF305 family)
LRKILAVLALASASLSLVGCTTQTAGDEALSNTDVMFLEMMIPHHEQAMDMAHLAEKNTTNPEILALAEVIDKEQHGEVDQMTLWLGKPMMDDHTHASHEMMGMLTEKQMQALADATGSEFDRLFLEGMILHHEGAIDMAQMVLASKNAEVKKLGESIIRSQTEQIAQMQKMLAALN